jgi:hypothetical protein
MHTMHHRKAVGLTTLDTTSTGSDRSPVSAKRRRKRYVRVISNDLLIAVAATCMLTVIAVLVCLKIYTAVTTTPTSDTKSFIAQQAAAEEENGSSSSSSEHALPWNKNYRIPGSMAVVGDRSDAYVELRKTTDPLLPPNADRSLKVVHELLAANQYASQLQPASMDVHHSDQVPYDIYDCPDTPPAGYPFAWNMLQILDNWGPDDTNPPKSGLIYHGLCVFDYQKDYDKAIVYRQAELPFVVVNDPAVAATVERWNTPGYLEKMLGRTEHRTEFSENNHFMYYVPVPKTRKGRRTRGNMQPPEGWTAPTKLIRMPYTEWLLHANVTDDKLGPHNPHWYYRLIGCGAMGNNGSCDQGSSEYLFDELTFFQPKESLYVVEPDEQKGYVGDCNTLWVSTGSSRRCFSRPCRFDAHTRCSLFTWQYPLPLWNEGCHCGKSL